MNKINIKPSCPDKTKTLQNKFPQNDIPIDEGLFNNLNQQINLKLGSSSTQMVNQPFHVLALEFLQVSV